jgi:2-oxoisovalerate dehydrogenase E1 component
MDARHGGGNSPAELNDNQRKLTVDVRESDLASASLLRSTKLDGFSFYVCSSFIREFEKQLLELFAKGQITGTTHTAIGQEANAVGVAAVCRETDIFVSNHRCHAHVLAHIGNPKKLLWEVMGDARGFCGGLGGSQHICVPDRFYSNGVLGGTAPLAVGLAFAKKLARSTDIVCLFIGDGAMGEGTVYESLNLAGLFRLPLLLVVEDNGIAQTTPTEATMTQSIAARLESFAFKTRIEDYPTAQQLSEAVRPLVAQVRLGQPAAIVIRSTRLGPHSKGDDTRSRDELTALEALDPLRRMAEELENGGRLDEANEAVEALMHSLNDARDDPITHANVPQPNYASLVISQSDLEEICGLGFVERLNEQLGDFLIDERSLLIGEDIGDPYGGAFKVTKGLQTRFPARVLQMPVSEAGFVGMAAGLAMSGWRPIVEIMFGDFAALAFDQLLNHATKYPLMYNGQVECPLTLRLPMGGGRGYGPTHSQNLEKYFCGVPNLQVFAVSPYLPLRPFYRAVRQADGPIILIEYKRDYARKVDLNDALLGDFDSRAHGDFVEFILKGSDEPQIAIFTYGGMIPLALEAARTLFIDTEISATVFAMGQLHPMRLQGLPDTYFAGVVLAVTVEEATTGWGFGAEIAALLMSKGLTDSARLVRIGAADTIVPTSRNAEMETLPGDPKKIATAILRGVEIAACHD